MPLHRLAQEERMGESGKDLGVIAAVLERMKTQRLPRALELKKKVNRGELLDDSDIEFLEQVVADSGQVRTYVEKHPEFKALAANMMNLYQEITKKALENEKTAG
jgi:hypothetical protein